MKTLAFNIIITLALGIEACFSATVPNRYVTNTDDVAISFNRLKLTNSLTYFVATTGSDANAGTNASFPLLTIQAAVAKALTWDFSTNNVTVQIADGAYSGSVLARQQLGNSDWKHNQGFLILHGDDVSPTSVVITNATTNHLVMAAQGTRMLIESLTVGSTNILNANLLDSQLFSEIGISNVTIGPSGVNAAQIVCESQSHFFTFGSNSIVAGGSLSHLLVLGSSAAWIVNTNGVFNTPAYSIAFAQAYGGGTVFLSHGGYIGNATGPRYNLLSGGSIVNFESGTPDTLLPGNAAGTQDARLSENSTAPVFIGTNGISGVTDGGNAQAGVVGEYTNRVLATGSALSLVNTLETNVLSMTLSPGDWNVSGCVIFVGTTATATRVQAGIGVVTNVIALDGSQCFQALNETSLSFTTSVTIPIQRVSTSISTNVFLVGQGNFSSGTMAACGQIVARRVR